jgi:hypothetical protein
MILPAGGLPSGVTEGAQGMAPKCIDRTDRDRSG